MERDFPSAVFRPAMGLFHLGPEMGIELSGFFWFHHPVILFQQLHQVRRVHFLFRFRCPGPPPEMEPEPAGSIHTAHEPVHVFHPVPGFVDPAPDLPAHGIGQDVFEQFPVFVLDQAFQLTDFFIQQL